MTNIFFSMIALSLSTTVQLLKLDKMCHLLHIYEYLRALKAHNTLTPVSYNLPVVIIDVASTGEM